MDTGGNQLILVANPGSASRKYALFEQSLTVRAALHFEIVDGRVACTIHQHNESHPIDVTFTDITESAAHISDIFRDQHILSDDEHIAVAGLRIVAPSAFFMKDHVITDEVLTKLQQVHEMAPIHVKATLDELTLLRSAYPQAIVVGVSDSAFHATKPNYAWNYGINLHDADTYDIKRFGYHGLSVAASIDALWSAGKLPPKVVVCHLGSGSSVSGVFHGRSIDTTMGYTPLEGVIMATRSGDISPGAVHALQTSLGLDWQGVEEYLNLHGGLLGLAGSNDIRELITRETNGDHAAHLALATLVHSIHKAIGAMIVAMNGCDALVFTGTVGERSAILRKRIVAHLEFMDFILDGDTNNSCTAPERLTLISQKAQSRPIVVIPTNEGLEIAKHAKACIQNQ